MRRTLAIALTSATTLAIGLSGPAHASTGQDRAAVLASFTQTGADSFRDWNAARRDRSEWREYAFDWGTDYCSASPDRPLGFDFRLACWRHDFGYRNYQDAGEFGANKERVDSALYADLKRTCATYRKAVRPACDTLAWVYYQAVVIFGSFAAVEPERVNRASELLGVSAPPAAARPTG